MSEEPFVEDTFTEVANESWLGRIGGAFIGIVIGLVLFIAAFPVLFWNEGRAVKRHQTLEEGAGGVISLPEARVLAEYDGKLVHVSGNAVTDDIVADPEFGVAVNAIKLNRKAEMYQWKETKKRKTQKKLGGGKKTVTTYSYSKRWSSTLIHSPVGFSKHVSIDGVDIPLVIDRPVSGFARLFDAPLAVRESGRVQIQPKWRGQNDRSFF